MSKKGKKSDKGKSEKGYRKNENLERNNNGVTKNGLGLLKFFVPMFIAGAYVVGVSFYQGLLNGQGFSSDHFPISIDEKYLMAYYALVTFLFSTVEPINGFWKSVLSINWSSIITLLVIAVTIHILVRFLIHEKQIKQWLDNQVSSVPSAKGYLKVARRILLEPLITFGIMYAMLIFTFIVLLIVVYLTGVISLPNSVGMKLAEKIKTGFQEKGCVYHESTKWNECVEIKDEFGKLIYRGKLVARYENSIGLIEEKTLRSVVYQLNDDELIVKYSNSK